MRIKDVPLRKLPQNLFISLGSHVELSSSSSPRSVRNGLESNKKHTKSCSKAIGFSSFYQ